ncbi:hypothetical protein MLD38_030607 [Melastoma candidum]|uniref:Uncharacterized protein n=1 Tax=Melastoma candidum TaxID=119954 RepID=A0ACB9MP29_9MYRT|nr:hypothetical protein MLD38_030607 [Melastoma candidum]
MTGYDWPAATATALALLFIFVYHLCTVFSSRNRTPPHPHSDPLPPPQVSVSEVVSEDDLELLIGNLDNPSPLENWETLIRRSTDLVSYTASCSKPKDGPVKYLSTTVFENCSPELLRDFYMDNSYRKRWDKTIVDHVQLQVDAASGTEVGQTVKKFPLLTAREYVLAWRLWKGSDSAYYCFTKECNHPLAPQHKKYVRVRYFRSGWRIRKVAGKNAAEIKMFHQEDAGLNMDMAKLAFAKGIWSYVLKMERALGLYPTASRAQHQMSASSIALIQKVPPRLERVNSDDPVSTSIATTTHGQSEGGRKLRRPSRRVLANSFLIIGGLVCLSKGHSSLGARVAVACLLAKLHKGMDSSGQSRSA